MKWLVMAMAAAAASLVNTARAYNDLVSIHNMSKQEQATGRGYTQILWNTLRGQPSPVRKRPTRNRHCQTVGSAVEPGKAMTREERQARHDSLWEEQNLKRSIEPPQPSKGKQSKSGGASTAPAVRQYNDTSFRDVYLRAWLAVIEKICFWSGPNAFWRGPNQQALLDEALALEAGAWYYLEGLTDINPIVALQTVSPSRARRIAGSIVTVLFCFLLVFGSLWALVQSFLTNIRAEAACTPTTVYVPFTTTVTALSTSLASADALSAGNDASITPTTTRTTTIQQTEATTVYVTPDVQPVSVLSSSGGASYFWQEVSGTTSWINGISPPSTESLTYGTTTIYISPIASTTPEVDSTLTVRSTSTLFGTTTITITPPMYTTTVYSMDSAISTSTLYMTTTQTIQVSQVITETRSSFSGIGTYGWNVTSVPVANAAGTGSADLASGVPATVTGTFYFGTGDVTTSTSTGLLTTTLTSRITQTNLITATITVSDEPDQATSSESPMASDIPVVSAGTLSLPPAANGTLSLPPVGSTLGSPQGASSISPPYPTMSPGSYGILPSASMSAASAPTSASQPVATIEAPTASLSISGGPSSSANSSVAAALTGSSASETPSGVPLSSAPGSESSASAAPSNSAMDTSITGSVTILPIIPSATRTVTLPSDTLVLPSDTMFFSTESSVSSAPSNSANSTVSGGSGVLPSIPSSAAGSFTGTPSESSTSFDFVSETPSATVSAAAMDSSSLGVPIGTGTASSESSSPLGYGYTPGQASTSTAPSTSASSAASTSPASQTASSASVTPSAFSSTSSTASASASVIFASTSASASFGSSSSSASSISSRSTSTLSSSIQSVSSSTSLITSRTSATVSSATATPSICGTDNGNFTLDWDDLGTFAPTDNSTSIAQAPPVRQPYHHLAFSNGYVYAPEPSEPYVPRSEPHLLVFLANNTASPSTGSGGSIRPGEIGNGRVDSDPAFWFNTYGAWMGCDNEGPDDCTLVMTAYAWDEASQLEQQVDAFNATLPPCDSLAECQLQEVEFPTGWEGLSGLQIQAFVDGGERMFFMDDLDMGWSNNSCAAGLARTQPGRRNGPGGGGLRMFKW